MSRRHAEAKQGGACRPVRAKWVWSGHRSVEEVVEQRDDLLDVLLRQIGAVELARYEVSTDVATVEAVLAGLAWTDNPADHLTRLLGFADSDRARVAVYAATRCARFARPDVLGRALDPACGAGPGVARLPCGP